MPTCLMLPGLNGSGPDHWQTRWEAASAAFQRVEFGCWSRPDRAVWLAMLDAAVTRAPAPIILVAHSLGCHAAAHWANWAPANHLKNIAAAMLVAPPDLESVGSMEQLRSFAPASPDPLPFPSLLVASRDDPYSRFEASARLAQAWGATLVDAGRQGHLNAQSCIGNWPQGRRWLDGLLDADICQARGVQLAPGTESDDGR